MGNCESGKIDVYDGYEIKSMRNDKNQTGDRYVRPDKIRVNVDL